MTKMKNISVIFVCMGNICRSPSAEGVFRHAVSLKNMNKNITIESAGTHAYHIGSPPDPRSQAAALQRGIDLSQQLARHFKAEDFINNDYVLAMDNDNLAIMRSLCPAGHEHKLSLFLEFAPRLGVQEVPDPYYGGEHGFEKVLDLIEAASEGLLADIQHRHFS